MGRLNGKVAIVTGAALGIGAYYARGLAAEGAWVAIADIEPADKVVAAIKEAGGEAMSAICDVSDGAAVAKFVHAVDEAYGGIDILVNNAALARMGRTPVEEMNSDEWGSLFRGQRSRHDGIRQSRGADHAPPANTARSSISARARCGTARR